MMIVILRTQSISDVITNSSSELFVVHNQKSKNQEIEELIDKVITAAGLVPSELYKTWVASNDMTYDFYRHIKIKRGDLVIESVTDNSIPGWVMEFIESLDYSNINRYHLG